MHTKNAKHLSGLVEAAARMSADISELAEFAERVNPRRFDFSPRMVALVGAIIGFDYGVRDPRGNKLRSIAITSDGYVLGNGVDEVSQFGDARDLDSSFAELRSLLCKADAKRLGDLYVKRVTDYRTVRVQ